MEINSVKGIVNIETISKNIKSNKVAQMLKNVRSLNYLEFKKYNIDNTVGDSCYELDSFSTL